MTDLTPERLAAIRELHTIHMKGAAAIPYGLLKVLDNVPALLDEITRLRDRIESFEDRSKEVGRVYETRIDDLRTELLAAEREVAKFDDLDRFIIENAGRLACTERAEVAEKRVEELEGALREYDSACKIQESLVESGEQPYQWEIAEKSGVLRAVLAPKPAAERMPSVYAVRRMRGDIPEPAAPFNPTCPKCGSSSEWVDCPNHDGGQA